MGLAGVYELAEGIDCQDDMTAAIQALKDAGADVIVVSFHWGTEKENYPDETQQALAHAAIDREPTWCWAIIPMCFRELRSTRENILFTVWEFLLWRKQKSVG